MSADRDTWENYGRYCNMILTEHPGLIPSTFEDWVAFNRAVDQTEEGR